MPATCVSGGQTRVAGRDGAIEIDVDLWDRRTLHGTNRIKADGSFAFWFTHRADVAKAVTYTVWVHGRFAGATVRGRARAVSSSDFWGKCRGDSAFDGRRGS